jgi:protein-tyrosine phosphatase
MQRTIFIALAVTLGLAARTTAQIADSSRRHVALQGAINFRDLGGYPAADGHHVKWNVLYRSADISHLTGSDLQTLNALHIHYDVDLRGVAESAKAPDRLNPNTDYILCPAGSDSANNWMKQLAAVTGSGDSLMISYYTNTTYLAARYKPFFAKLLALPDSDALVFHCTAGKDRTGIGAALLLYALGVPMPVIEEDYTATNYYRQSENLRMIKGMSTGMHIDERVAKDMLSAKKEYLDATFDAIRQQYGSIDSYLQDQLGLDGEAMAKLRKKFLE